jgi:hypothetical protein
VSRSRFRWTAFALLTGLVACDASKQADHIGDKVADKITAKVEDKAKHLADKVSKGVGNAFQKENFSIDVSDPLIAKGLTASRSVRLPDTDQSKGVSIYMVADKAFNGPLQLRAFDKNGHEIGRAKARLNIPEGEAKFVDFQFDPRTPMNAMDRLELR